VNVCLLVVAKAPVPGFAKTRLCPPATPEQAAAIAAAALLDTLDAALATGLHTVVALTGTLARAVHAQQLAETLTRCTTIQQRGDGFAQRLVHAHADAAALKPGAAILQIGSDTPQLTAATLVEAAAALHSDGHGAVLGPASDGGWWALGLRDPAHAALLHDVPMSTSDTGRRTAAALTGARLRVRLLAELSDVDTMADAERVRVQAPHGRFAAAVARVGR
jgi:rSAM/selenodomain-associated transferase 1